jgi:hypothetical protein
LAAVVFAGCETPPPSIEPTAPSTALTPTPAPTRPLGVAVPVGSPTPTPQLLGDYATLVRPQLDTVHQDLTRLEQQLGVLRTAPMRMAEDDWRSQLQSILQDLLVTSADIRTLGTRVSVPSRLSSEMMKLTDDLDFVANEYRMALDYDPDASHFIRAGRAEKTTAAELDSVLTDLH